MTEYLVQHTITQHWTSITVDRNDTHALIVRDDIIETVPYATAETILDYVSNHPDYRVKEVY